MSEYFTLPIEVSIKPMRFNSTGKQGKQLAKQLTHNAPPINEVGLSVSTITEGVIDSYDVRGLHESFPDLPNAQRQSSIGILELATLVGGGTNSLDFSNGPPQKWWFVSADDTRVLQVQDNFLSYNWRRGSSFPGDPVDYPGFEKIFEEYQERLALIREWHDRKGKSLPVPAGCELMYDDIIPLVDSNGQNFPLSEALVEFNRAEADRPSSAWSSSWFETIDGLPTGDPSTLRIQLYHLGMVKPETGENFPILKTTFTAGAARSTWEEVLEFFHIAHAHVQKRFLALIDPKVQATWNK
jgi:uncharacterized protein (TIGR04255 family)